MSDVPPAPSTPARSRGLIIALAVVQAITLLLTATFILINLAVDLLYVALDPRVRLQRGGA